MDTKLVRGLLVLAVVGIATLPAFSQADVSSATLKGTVTDPSGALLPGAAVTAKNVETGITRETITDALGAYLIRPFTARIVRASHHATRVCNQRAERARSHSPSGKSPFMTFS